MAILQKTTAGFTVVDSTRTEFDTVYVNTQRDMLAPPTGYTGSGSDSYILGANFVNGSAVASSVVQNFVLPAGLRGIKEVTLSGTVKHNVDTSAFTNTIANTKGLTITGNSADNNIVGTRFNDSINGLAGNDVITGGLGTDNLLGGNNSFGANTGSDVFIYNAGKELTFQETVVGGEDFSFGPDTNVISNEIDEVRFASRTAGDTLVLGPNVSGIESVVIGTGTRANTDSTVSITLPTNPTKPQQQAAETKAQETYLGRLMHGRFTTADTTGRTALNVDASLYNEDLYLLGNAGNNRIVGSQQADLIVGGGGADQLFGGSGNDVFAINAGAQYVTGDSINGGSGRDSIYVNTRDTIKLNNRISSVEEIYSGLDANGTAVNTNIDASNVNASVMSFFGNSAVNTIKGTAGEDTFSGFDGKDSLDGGDNNNDTLVLTTGSPVIQNNLNLVPPSITSFVDTNDATLKNIEQIDIRNNGISANFTLNLSKQTESFVINDNTGEDSSVSVIAGSGENDTLNLNSFNSFSGFKNYSYSTDASLAGVENIVVSVGSALDLSTQTEDFNVSTSTNGFGPFISGVNYSDSQGADNFTGSDFADTVNVKDTSAINDFYVASRSTDNSNDTFNVSATIDGGALALNGFGFETINLNGNTSGKDFTLNLSNFRSDALITIANLGIVNGESFNDINYEQFINTGAGNDTVIGNASDNFFSTGDGDDTIIGNGGTDIIEAGAGADYIDLSSSNVFTSSNAYVVVDNNDALGFSYTNAANDLFDFSANGVDVIDNTSGGNLEVILRFVGELTDQVGVNANGSVDNAGITVVRGNYNNTTKIFTESSIGNDDLIVYDQNSSTTVDTVGVVVLGRGSYDLNYDVPAPVGP